MNYLAHAYLSFNHTEILLGNMGSDFIKGKKQYDYPEGIQKGISLHREIDNYTDTHEATREARQYFKESVGLYAGAFVDVVYDHFLAIDTSEFENKEMLKAFAQNTYATLRQHIHLLPQPFQQMFPYMQQHDWLYNYQFRQGIERSFAGLVRRASYLSSHELAFRAFEDNYASLQNCYMHFFPSVKKMAQLLIEK